MKIHKIHIIAEGKSEKVYFAKLNRLSRELIDGVLLFEVYSCNGNNAKSAREQWSTAQTKRDKKSNEEVLLVLDFDCFKRGDKDINAYNNFAKNNIYFFIMNFEDFLIQHLSKEKVLFWKGKMQQQNHFENPLNSGEVAEKIKGVLPTYKKSEVPFEINTDSLQNLANNYKDFNHGNNNFIDILLAILQRHKII
ncbi:MAG: hypothetical protein FWG57_09095 [Endomicrobia bacterium]|nr:hypothetical protein [Bacillota bacterium]MCL1973118.1 hypothetical protein [Endomicrobiia bacterium]